MSTINILRTGSLVLGGSSGHADTRFTVDGEVESKNISGTLDQTWMANNGYFDDRERTWLKTITQADIGNTVTSIGDFAFYNCTNLTSVTIPNIVESIGEQAFANCRRLTNMTIPNSVTSIGFGAFAACTGLTSVTICNGVNSIGNSAFMGCSGLTSMTIPDSVTSIENYAFLSCNGLTSITVLGKTTAQAQTLLAYADVPAGCTIVGELG